MHSARWVFTRLLGVGLAAALAVVTLSLAVTGQLSLYINPDSAWFAVGMAIVLLIGAPLTFLLPLGAEADDGHGHAHDEDHALDRGAPRRASLGRVAAVTGGVLSGAIVLTMLVLPPTALSTQLALERGTGAPPLFAGSDTVALATTGDTASFGVGDWASVFATATDPDAFVGKSVTLTGFVAPDDDGRGFGLTRLVITHCVIDAQPATVPVATDDLSLPAGQWVSVSGTIRPDPDGTLRIAAADVTEIDPPGDPYEY